MNQSLKTFIGLITLLSIGASVPASENKMIATSIKSGTHPPALAAPAILSKNISLDAAEMKKYECLAKQSQKLAAGEAAGASTRNTVIVVAVIVATVAAIALYNTPVAGLPPYTGPM